MQRGITILNNEDDFNPVEMSNFKYIERLVQIATGFLLTFYVLITVYKKVKDRHNEIQFVTTWCQILCSMRLQCVSKILTPLRMLQKTSLIAKINLWNNSFQNMYDML